MLNQKRLKEILDYDEKNGLFTRKNETIKFKKGRLAGNIRKDKYVAIWVDGKRYLAHRLAWLYVYGVWPKEFIDHINGNPNDNSILNLREATYAQNAQNIRFNKANKSGFMGVWYNKKMKRYRARIILNRKTIGLGHYKSAEEASIVYLEAKKRIHDFCNI